MKKTKSGQKTQADDSQKDIKMSPEIHEKLINFHHIKRNVN